MADGLRDALLGLLRTRPDYYDAEFDTDDLWTSVPEISLPYYDGGYEVDIEKLVDLILASEALAEHDRGQQIKGIQGLLDFRPLPRDVRRYIEGYLEAAAEEAGRESAGDGQAATQNG